MRDVVRGLCGLVLAVVAGAGGGLEAQAPRRWRKR